MAIGQTRVSWFFEHSLGSLSLANLNHATMPVDQIMQMQPSPLILSHDRP